MARARSIVLGVILITAGSACGVGAISSTDGGPDAASPDGVPSGADAAVDATPALPTCACYYGAGLYCGAGIQIYGASAGCTVPGLGQNLGNLYTCAGSASAPGTWTVSQTCAAAGCIVAPPGVNDSCKSTNEYYLPWARGVTYRCTQGNNQGSHTGAGAYAWDFGLPTSTPVWAARAGTVSLVQFLGSGDPCWNGVNPACTSCVSQTDGVTDCLNRGNYVVVDHGDGTQALYLHLWEVDVRPGQAVALGQVIAKSGDSGCSCGAHLHYMVSRASGTNYYSQSIPSMFVEAGVPVTGQAVTSQNP
ncbi:MAG TPA: M23 family metallopeptidase [Haliangiales bacterium]|nr:M23 family metallopeptidase [Haliangiales bacterium]